MKKYQYKVQGVDYEVEIAEVEGKIAKVNVNGIPFEIEMQKPINAAKHPVLAATKRAAAPQRLPQLVLLLQRLHLPRLPHNPLRLQVPVMR